MRVSKLRIGVTHCAANFVVGIDHAGRRALLEDTPLDCRSKLRLLWC
jgi:hypothetical protein